MCPCKPHVLTKVCLPLLYLLNHANAHLSADHKNGGGNSKHKKQKNKKDVVGLFPDVSQPGDNNPVKNGEPADMDMDHGPKVIIDTRVKVSSLAADTVGEETTTEDEVKEETMDENTGELVVKELTWVDSP